MNAPTREGLILTREGLILERLRETYEHQGYEFFAHPLPDMLPSFLGEFRPDAIALRAGEGVIIEVKGRHRPDKDPRIGTVAGLVSGQKGWQLRVISDGSRPEDMISIDIPTHAQIESQIAEAEQLASGGHGRASFLLAWSVLEAVTRALTWHDNPSSRRPFSAAQTVQSLETAGLMDSQKARTLRAHAQLRNLIAHGDLSTDVGRDVVQGLIRQVRELSATANPA